MHKYEIVGYDVIDGEVNDAYFVGLEFTLPEDFTMQDVKRGLFRSGYCHRGVLNAKLEFDGDGFDTIYLRHNSTRRQHPFCELRKIT